jgi:hypothetical protein
MNRPNVSSNPLGISVKRPVSPFSENPVGSATAVAKQPSGLIEQLAAVARLQEYRTALITAAFTGKIDVRNSAPARGSTPDSGWVNFSR